MWYVYFLSAAAAYFYFNWRYFSLVSVVLQKPRVSKLVIVWTFMLNYGLFVVCGMQEWNLIINWGLFFLFQLVETAFYCRDGWRVPLFFSLNGILYGLTVNIFCRCSVSIALSLPLVAFDNNISAYGNFKALPVNLGFILGGAVLHLMILPKSVKNMRTLIAHPKHLNFQLELMTGMFLYLFLNLLLYRSKANDVLLKLWGIKSTIFSLVGTYLGLRYSLKMCVISDYREQNRTIQQSLLQGEWEEEHLRSMAYRDTLTGMYNRQFALDQMERLMHHCTPFTLCFLDLNDLKGVNDHYGHAEGDRYLITVAHELMCACRQDWDIPARYGGDEFLILFPEADLSTIEKRLQQVNRGLAELTRSGEIPFPMSVSYGIVNSCEGIDIDTLLVTADQKMYQNKRKTIDVQQKERLTADSE